MRKQKGKKKAFHGTEMFVKSMFLESNAAKVQKKLYICKKNSIFAADK